MIERFKNNKGKIDVITCYIGIMVLVIIIGIVLLCIDVNNMNKVNVYDHGREATHIEVDKNLAFDGYEWNDGDLILHYKEGEIK